MHVVLHTFLKKLTMYPKHLSGVACNGDWGRANLFKALNVPLCLIPLL